MVREVLEIGRRVVGEVKVREEECGEDESFFFLLSFLLSFLSFSLHLLVAVAVFAAVAVVELFVVVQGLLLLLSQAPSLPRSSSSAENKEVIFLSTLSRRGIE